MTRARGWSGPGKRQRRRERSRTLVAAAGAVALAACGPGPTGTGPRSDPLADQPSRFEAPPRASASDLWPPLVVQGDHHAIEEGVASDGFLRVYRMHSDYGDFEVRGDDLLWIRLREVRALSALQEMSKTQEFARAVGHALGTPFVATWNLITRPVGTIAGIPAGALRFLARTPGLTRGERGELEDSAARELIGFAARKRQLAYELGVDPYSSNRALQKELNRHAWAAYAGGLPFNLAPFLRAEPLSEQLAKPVLEPTLAELLRDLSPEELRERNRDRLLRMQLPGELVEAFVEQPWYSPRHQTVIVDALEALGVTLDRAAFLRVALTATSEEDALFFQCAAEMLRHYHRTDVPLERLVALDALVAGYTAARVLVVPLMADSLTWSRPAEILADTLTRDVPPQLELLAPREVALLLTGTATERARAELAKRGIDVREQVLGPRS